MSLFQILFILFTLFALAGTIKKFKDGVLSGLALAFWFIVWVCAGVAVLWPELSQKVADTFGIGRGTDLVVYSVLAVMLYLLFRFHIKLAHIERDITQVVRNEALKKK